MSEEVFDSLQQLPTADGFEPNVYAKLGNFMVLFLLFVLPLLLLSSECFSETHLMDEKHKNCAVFRKKHPHSRKGLTGCEE